MQIKFLSTIIHNLALPTSDFLHSHNILLNLKQRDNNDLTSCWENTRVLLPIYTRQINNYKQENVFSRLCYLKLELHSQEIHNWKLKHKYMWFSFSFEEQKSWLKNLINLGAISTNISSSAVQLAIKAG